MSRYKVSGPISADEKVNLCERVMWKVSLCGMRKVCFCEKDM